MGLTKSQFRVREGCEFTTERQRGQSLIRRPGRREEEHRECIRGFEAIDSRKGHGGVGSGNKGFGIDASLK